MAWSIAVNRSLPSISNDTDCSFTLGASQTAKITLSFAESGTVTFESSGASSSYASLGTSSAFDSASGSAANEVDLGYSQNGDFSFEYDVVAGQTYYLFVSHYTESDSGSMTVSILLDGSSSGGGSSGSDRWVIEYAYDCRNTSSTVSQFLTLDRYQVAMFRCSFTESGKVTFSSGGADSTWAALSLYSDFDGNTGTPDSRVAYDSNNNGDFSFDYNVTAGSTYYLFVMHYDSSDYGSMTVYIEPESSGSSEKWTVYGYSQYTNLSANTSRSISLGAMYTAMFTISFVNSGTAKFYTTGSVDTVGYLSTSTGFDSSTGQPTSSLRTSDDDGSGNNFLISYPVTAGTTYYLFIKCYSSSAALVTTVCIDAPTVGAPAAFNWSSAKVAGGTFNITADEWCDLLDKINEVRVYKGLAEMQTGASIGYFTYPSSGDDFLALHYNQALMGIAGIYSADGYSGYYNNYAVSSGDAISASAINLLRTLINNYCE